jgi:hypothetical protein
MTSFAFLVYVALISVAFALVSVKYLTNRAASVAIIGLFAWLGYVGVFSGLGFAADEHMIPPGVVWIVAPTFPFIVFLARSKFGLWLASTIPLSLLLGLQSFRIGVEYLVHRLWNEGLTPKIITFSGNNVDI